MLWQQMETLLLFLLLLSLISFNMVILYLYYVWLYQARENEIKSGRGWNIIKKCCG